MKQMREWCLEEFFAFLFSHSELQVYQDPSNRVTEKAWLVAMQLYCVKTILHVNLTKSGYKQSQSLAWVIQDTRRLPFLERKAMQLKSWLILLGPTLFIP